MPQDLSKSLNFDFSQARSLDDLRAYFVLAELDLATVEDGYAVKDAYGRELGSLELCEGTYYFKNAEGIYTYYYDSETGEWANLDFYLDPQGDSPLYNPTSGTALANNAQRTGDAAPTRTTASSGSGSGESQRTTTINTDPVTVSHHTPVVETPPTIFVPRTSQSNPTPIPLPQITFSSDAHTTPVAAPSVAPHVFAAAAVAPDQHAVATSPEQIPPVRSGAVVCFAPANVGSSEPQAEPVGRPAIIVGGTAAQTHLSDGNEPASPAVIQAQADGSTTRDDSIESATLHQNPKSDEADPIIVDQIPARRAANEGGIVIALGENGDGEDVPYNAFALPIPFTPFSGGSGVGQTAAMSDRERYAITGVDNHHSDSHGDEDGGNGREGRGRDDGEDHSENDQA